MTDEFRDGGNCGDLDRVGASKQRHREKARAVRQALHPEACTDAAAHAAELLLGLPELTAARLVLAYSANAEEIDPSPALDGLRELGKAIALPRVESPGVLGLHVFEHGDPLEVGPFGIGQPLETATRLETEDVDAVIVPGVAFDLAGHRLGYGGGYYDRLLGLMREDCARIGYAYDEQVSDGLPVHEHDEHMDAIVTPTRVIHPE